MVKDSSDEDDAHAPITLKADHTLPTSRTTSVSVGTQTQGSWLEHIQALAEFSSLAVVDMNLIRDQFWASILACMKMPRGGVNAGGSMHCSFEFVCASEAVVKHLMEDLPVMRNQRYNLSLPSVRWNPPGEKSPTISTYYAEDLRPLDGFFRLHRRRAARGYPAYRGSLLLNPLDDHPAPVCQLSAVPPFLAEYCQRKHGKLVLAVSFNVSLLNDQNLQSLPPNFPYALGMDAILQTRALNHLTKLRLKGCRMSELFSVLATGHPSTAPQSEGEWDPLTIPRRQVRMLAPVLSSSDSM